MAKFKVGDEVRVVGGVFQEYTRNGRDIAVITRLDVDEALGRHEIEWPDGGTSYAGGGDDYGRLELLTTTKEKETMSLIDKVRELSTAEPLKSFVKYGIKEQNGKLTAEGAEVLLSILADKHEAELVKVTDALAAADKAAKK